MLYSLVVETWYVCIPVIFALAVLDPVLTVLSYRRYRATLAKRVDMEQFELNPRWQKAVKAGQFLPLSYVVRILLGLAVLMLFFIMPRDIFGPDHSPRAVLIGYLLCQYLVVDLNHIGNLRIFGLKRAKPEEETGEEKPKARLGYSYSVGLTQVSYETTFLMLLILWLVLGGYFLFGAAIAPLVIAYRLRFMRANALRREQGLSPRNYRSFRLAVLLMVIAAALAFAYHHRIESYYWHHVNEGNKFFAAGKFESAAAEYSKAAKYKKGEEAVTRYYKSLMRPIRVVEEKTENQSESSGNNE